MKKTTRKRIQKIIDTEYQTDWEFVCNNIMCEVDEAEACEDDFIDEVSDMIAQTKIERQAKLHSS